MSGIENIKTTVNKIVADGEKKDDGLKSLEDKMSDIKEILNQTLPTLHFAKECIKVCGGSDKLLKDLLTYKKNEMIIAQLKASYAKEGE